MEPDRLQLQRLELKYRISERTAGCVREFVRSFLEIDEYGLGRPELSYPIHSLYLDSDNLRTYRETINGTNNRYKLRLRYYHDEPGSPVFFEVKRRHNDAILKQRAGVRRNAVDCLLAGQLPEPQHLLCDRPDQLVALQNFSRLILDIQAVPRAHVAYRREAWVSTRDNSIRVTMDREVTVAPQFRASFGLEQNRPVRPFGRMVILELKFTGRFPSWFHDLVQQFNLDRSGAAKYADGVKLLGEMNVGGRQPPELAVLPAAAVGAGARNCVPGATATAAGSFGARQRTNENPGGTDPACRLGRRDPARPEELIRELKGVRAWAVPPACLPRTNLHSEL